MINPLILMHPRKTNTYYAEIDGLRTIAILPVVLYHFKQGLFSGGYVGVDVFFVISGFVITGFIVSEIDSHRFSLSAFYERRMRRIFPGLFTIFLFCLAIGIFFFDFNSFVELGNSLIASSMFVSNIYFWQQSGYFEMPAVFMPLLHTWSLAIEEQFYIFFPLFLLIVYRRSRAGAIYMMTLAFLVSLGVCIYGAYYFPSASFYLLPTRIWELMAGALVCFIPIKNFSSRYIVTFGQLAGTSMILASVILFTDEVRFPGFAALLPVMGTGILLYFRNEGTSAVNKVLRLKVFVFIGRISYSLYLWHWPVFSLFNYIFGSPVHAGTYIALLSITFGMAVLSWKYIEQPLRNPRKNWGRVRRPYIYFAVIALLFVGAGLLIRSRNGFPGRFTENNYLLEHNANIADTIYQKLALYQDVKATSINDGDLPYKFGDLSVQPAFMVWGDSHARALYFGLDSIAKKRRVSAYIASLSSRGPLLNVNMKHDNGNKMSDFNSSVFNFIKKHKEIKTVVLIARWRGYTSTEYEIKTADSLSKNGTQPGPRTGGLLEEGLNNTIRGILALNRKIVIVSNVPELKYDIRNVIGKMRANYFFGTPVNDDVTMTTKAYYEMCNESFRLFSNFNNPMIKIVHVEVPLILEDHFVYVANDHFLYGDQNHLSRYGSLYVAAALNSIFEN